MDVTSPSPEETYTGDSRNDSGDRQLQVQISVIPQLSARRGRAAIDFYLRAFGAVEAYRVNGTDEHPDVVS